MTGDETDLREEARKRVTKKRDLGAHVVVYVVVNTMVVVLWAMTGGGYFWPAWLMVCWGVGLILNIWDVYFRRPVTEHDVDREMDRLLGK
jgi:uncharacterized ion transporter superfamily protein YfcC